MKSRALQLSLSRMRGARQRGFTLLEVIIATMAVAMITMVLYRFVSTTLQALDLTQQESEQRLEVEMVAKLVEGQLNDLPARGVGIIGKANKFNNLQADELTWITRSGSGVMTGAAPGEYRVTLTVQPSEEDKSILELGLRRELVTQEDKQDVDFFTRGSGTNKYNWLVLVRPVAALEVRYWDARLNSPVQQWTDVNARPSFVHLKIWKHVEDLPYDTIIQVPTANLQQQAGRQ